MPQSLRARGSLLFKGVRTVGVVTDGLPFSLVKLGTVWFIVVSVGRAYQVYDAMSLRITAVSPQMPVRIGCLANNAGTNYVGLDSTIGSYAGLKQLRVFEGHRKAPSFLFVFGHLLISFNDEEMVLWNTEKGELEGRLPLDSGFSPSAITHPPTYLNKVVIGSRDGRLELWNVRTQKKVFAFRGHLLPPGASSETLPAVGEGVTSLEAAPNALDVTAVGFSSGRVTLLDTRTDTALAEFRQGTHQGGVVSLTFRSDGGGASGSGDSGAYLVTGTSSGDICVWDLAKKQLHSVVESAHVGAVSRVAFLPGQPLLISSGRDNALVMWIFDLPDGGCRELKSRRGHAGAISRIRFYDEEGTTLLSTSRAVTSLSGGSANSLQGVRRRPGLLGKTSMILAHQSSLFSQKVLRKKKEEWSYAFKLLPPFTDLSFCASRHFDWPAIVSTHEGHHHAFVWSGHSGALVMSALRRTRPAATVGRGPLRKEDERVVASSVAVSLCGNFVAVGYEDGEIHRFNLQSSLHRGAFTGHARGRGEAKGTAERKCHLSRVSCLVPVRSSPPSLMSACPHPLDCGLSLFDWRSQKLKGRVSLREAGAQGRRPKAARSVEMTRTLGALAAVGVCSMGGEARLLVVDLIAGLADTEGGGVGGIVRDFPLSATPTDMTFSPDGRWVCASTVDRQLVVFDLLAARRVDWLLFPSVCLSLSFDPSGSFLFTSHDESPGSVCVWANKQAVDPTAGEEALLSKMAVSPIEIEGPAPGVDTGEGDVEMEGEEEETGDGKGTEKEKEEADPLLEIKGLDPLAGSLLTLCGQPPERLQALVLHDVIRERNKTIEAEKPLEKAPFFLPTRVPGAVPEGETPGSSLWLDAADLEEGGGGETGEPGGSSASAGGPETWGSFFLGGGGGASGEEEEEGGSSSKKRLGTGSKGAKGMGASSAGIFRDDGTTQLQFLLRRKKFEAAMELLARLSPPAVHLVLSQLGPLAGGRESEVTLCLEMFAEESEKGARCDLVQALLAVFLQHHGSSLMEEGDGVEGDEGPTKEVKERADALSRLELAVRTGSRRLGSSLGSLSCFLKFLSNLQME
uniref:Uncharacterized protein n=1 Tax=Chromera velia CCMP2878 TaxID=1169474 RepID=A0A0G4FX48_9ALVE|eukprot:Cvel_19201.t1-p1 / transcript=Cvel_19201.t1 / gene=Cvel_19201 / organism=Chromera_velia_CCMP2878 / gene_product=WD repeat-containing protein 36, putative / transcript_product=WD repeat-containing protein 36, putative / location=Cvel_scaffold1638:22081-30828(+) / protein_length=1077 / sequence_SO=supercontig / SO=protein_coding / is_pseudo=false